MEENRRHVPKTQGSGLTKRLQEAEHRLSAITKERVRVTERGGKRMLQLLHTNDPFAGAPCGRPTCIPCTNGDKEKKENCNKRGIVYKTFCGPCQEEAKIKRARGRRPTPTSMWAPATWPWQTGAPPTSGTAGGACR